MEKKSIKNIENTNKNIFIQGLIPASILFISSFILLKPFNNIKTKDVTILNYHKEIYVSSILTIDNEKYILPHYLKYLDIKVGKSYRIKTDKNILLEIKLND